MTEPVPSKASRPGGHSGAGAPRSAGCGPATPPDPALSGSRALSRSRNLTAGRTRLRAMSARPVRRARRWAGCGTWTACRGSWCFATDGDSSVLAPRAISADLARQPSVPCRSAAARRASRSGMPRCLPGVLRHRSCAGPCSARRSIGPARSSGSSQGMHSCHHVAPASASDPNKSWVVAPVPAGIGVQPEHDLGRRVDRHADVPVAHVTSLVVVGSGLPAGRRRRPSTKPSRNLSLTSSDRSSPRPGARSGGPRRPPAANPPVWTGCRSRQRPGPVRSGHDELMASPTVELLTARSTAPPWRPHPNLVATPPASATRAPRHCCGPDVAPGQGARGADVAPGGGAGPPARLPAVRSSHPAASRFPSLWRWHGRVPDGRERTAPGHHAMVEHQVESLGEGAGRVVPGWGAGERSTRCATRSTSSRPSLRSWCWSWTTTT
jgi:hypothetical protein